MHKLTNDWQKWGLCALLAGVLLGATRLLPSPFGSYLEARYYWLLVDHLGRYDGLFNAVMPVLGLIGPIVVFFMSLQCLYRRPYALGLMAYFAFNAAGILFFLGCFCGWFCLGVVKVGMQMPTGSAASAELLNEILPIAAVVAILCAFGTCSCCLSEAEA